MAAAVRVRSLAVVCSRRSSFMLLHYSASSLPSLRTFGVTAPAPGFDLPFFKRRQEGPGRSRRVLDQDTPSRHFGSDCVALGALQIGESLARGLGRIKEGYPAQTEGPYPTPAKGRRGAFVLPAVSGQVWPYVEVEPLNTPRGDSRPCEALKCPRTGFRHFEGEKGRPRGKMPLAGLLNLVPSAGRLGWLPLVEKRCDAGIEDDFQILLG
jgi:hypothetical protein